MKPRPKTLREQVPACLVEGGAGLGNFQMVSAGLIGGIGGWELVQNSASLVFAVYRSYFDLSGLTSEELTTFVMGADFQEGNCWIQSNPTPTGAIHTWDLLTDNYIEDEAFDAVTTQWNLWNPPGMLASQYDLREVFAGKRRTMCNDSTVPGQVVVTSSSSWGAGNATAGDKLHFTRVFLCSGAIIPGDTNSEIVSPPAAIVVPVMATKEKDLVHIERMRRSYVLAGNR